MNLREILGLAIGTGVAAFTVSCQASSRGASNPRPAKPLFAQTYISERQIDQKLFDAIRKNDVARVKLLLDKGADANANEANGWRPLISLDTTSPRCVEIAKLLLAHGAKIDYRQPDQGFTPLTQALNGYGAIELIRFLISKGADVNLGMNDGTTGLMLAVRYGNTAAVKELIRNGAKVNVRTVEDPSIVEVPENKVRASDAFEPGFKWSGRNVAIELGNKWNDEIADLLSAAGMDLKAADDSGWTALHWAAKMGNLDGIRALLKRGLNPNATSKAGFTPLHLAVRAGYGFPMEPAVEALLHAGADPKIKNVQGQTPADLLRADVTRQLASTRSSPEELGKDESIRKYLLVANAIAQRLEPGSPKVMAPEIPKVNGNPNYPPLEIGGGYDRKESQFKLRRAMQVIGGRTILTLRPESPLPPSMKLRLTKIQLNNYETSTPLPQTADPVNGFTFSFPAEAIKAGCALQYSYSFTSGNSSGNGNGSEGWEPSPGLQQLPTNEGTRVSIQCDLRDRPLEVRLDSVTVNGKLQNALAAKMLRVNGSAPTLIGVFPKGASVQLKYSYRLVPNVRWEKESIDLGRY